jgi:hypothetical protein
VIELLVTHGADVNLADEQGIVPLHSAAAGGSAAAAEALIDHGADVDARDEAGYTALHAAAMIGNRLVAELLIERGADVNAENMFGRTPLNEAIDAGQRRMVRLLERHGGKEGTDAGLPFTNKAAFVVVDRSEPAFIVMTGVAEDSSEEEIAEIRARVGEQDQVEMLTWEDFSASADDIAESFMLVTDYPELRVIDGLRCLVGSEPGAPWGLTWNGGIALTMMDYSHTRRSYEQFVENPREVRRLDPRSDPVYPANVLMFFGCLFL